MPHSPLALSPLTAISAIDGRYATKTTVLRGLFSEYGLIKHRVKLEIEWFKYLTNCEAIPEATQLSNQALAITDSIVDEFDVAEAQAVKAFEAVTNHDVKAVEYYLKEHFKKDKELNQISNFLHFAITSEDINSLAWALILKQACNEIILPALHSLSDNLNEMANTYAEVALLARTHGQAASPTTVGKEFANFVHRLRRQIQLVEAIQIPGKFSGAVGNFNAHYVAYPNLNWPDMAKQFVTSLGLEYLPCTSQIEPHDHLAELLDALGRISCILIDLCRDIWGYIALGHFDQKMKEGEIGSSTMPHKVNPIDFENAEGNLGLAHALAQHMSSKLPISRWQRDLSDSTVLRSLGAVFGHILISFDSLERGLSKIKVNQKMMSDELDKHWEVLGEALQTMLRKHGVTDGYEILKEFTRGKCLDAKSWRKIIELVDLPEEEKQQLLALTPADYTGIASILARR